MKTLPLRAVLTAAAILTLLLTLASTAAAAAPPNDNFASAQALTLGADPVNGTTADATQESGEPGYGSSTVWYRADAPSGKSGVVEFTVCSSSGYAYADGYMGTPSSTLATIVDYEDNSYYLCSLAVRVAVTSGSRAFLQVDSGGVAFTVSARFVESPANDSFSAAAEISGSHGQFDFDTTNATWELGEQAVMQSNDYYYDGRSLWYKWTAPASGTVSLTACSEEEDAYVSPQVTLFTGSTLAAMTSLKKSDTGCPSEFDGGTIFWEVVGGTTYRIRVNSYYTDDYYGPGTLTLQFNTLPTNDLIANAIDLGNDAFVSTSGTNWTASTTPEEGEPGIYTVDARPASVWFKWTAPSAGVYRIDQCESRSRRADFVIGAFTSTGGGSATPSQLQKVVDANADDNCSTTGNSNRAGWFEINATAGTTYWIGVASYSDSGSEFTGPFSLRIRPASLESTAPPSINGAPFVGKTLNFVQGNWNSSTSPEFSYQWQRCSADSCADIAGATGTSYTLTADDFEKEIRVRETTDNGLKTVSVTTPRVGPIYYDDDDDGVPTDHGDACPSIPGAESKTNGCPVTDFVITGNPSIGGSAAVGASVSVQVGSAQNINLIDTTTPAPSARVRIESCSSAVDTASCEQRAEGTSYVITAADAGRHIRASVIWSNTDKERVVWTDAVGPVATLVNPASLTLPKKLGTLKQKKGKVAIKKAKLACAADATAACSGTATFSGKAGRKKFSVKIKLSVKPGKSASITLKLSKKQQKTLKTAKKSKGNLRVTFGGVSAKASLTLKR